MTPSTTCSIFKDIYHCDIIDIRHTLTLKCQSRYINHLSSTHQHALNCLLFSTHIFFLSTCFRSFSYSPPEKSWTYTCVNRRCVRKHYPGKGEKRTTFLTCSMLCGSQSLWPEPTGKSLIGTSAKSFRLTDVQYKIQTPFKNVESLMESAFAIFLDEVRQIRRASGGSSTDDDAMRSSTMTYKDVTYQGSRNRAETSKYQRRNLTTVNIYVNVIKTSDVHLTLGTDECYNITMSSEFLAESQVTSG